MVREKRKIPEQELQELKQLLQSLDETLKDNQQSLKDSQNLIKDLYKNLGIDIKPKSFLTRFLEYIRIK